MPKKEKTNTPLFIASSMGLHIISGTIVGGVAGYLLDFWLGTKPIFFLILLLLGIIAGFMNMFTDAKRLMQYHDDEDN